MRRSIAARKPYKPKITLKTIKQEKNKFTMPTRHTRARSIRRQRLRKARLKRIGMLK